MRLYHGSNIDIDKIDLTKSKPNKDFGPGFYLSSEYGQALEMAQQKVNLFETGNPIVNIFEFDESCLTNGKIKIKEFSDYNEEWAAFIISNRDKSETKKRHDYDIVIGPIANDRVGIQVRLFLNEYIDIKTLLTRLKFLKGITMQYYFGTEAAISYLKRVRDEQ